MVSKTIQELLAETKQMIQNTPMVWKIFNDTDKVKFNQVSIAWNKRKTYRIMGVYHNNTNSINITITLKECPDFVSQQVIWHELLHIHFNGRETQAHGKLFRIYEQAYPKFKEAKKYIMEEATKVARQKHQQKPVRIIHPTIQRPMIQTVEQLISQLSHSNTQSKPIIIQKPVVIASKPEPVLTALEICKKICQK